MDILNKDIVAQLISDVESDQNKQRKIREYKAFKIMEGDQLTYVKERNQEIFPETYGYMRNSNVDIVGRVVGKLSQSYSSKPKRLLAVEGDQKRYDEIVDQIGIDTIMQEFDKTYNAHYEVGAWISYDDDYENPYFARVLKPFEFDRVVSKRGVTEVVIVSFPTDDVTGNHYGDATHQLIQDENEDTEDCVYAMWTDEQHVIVRRHKKDLHFLPIPGNENNINPIGRIPFVFMQKGNSTYQQTTNTLSEKSVEWNSQNSVLLSYLDLIYGTWVLSHDDEQTLDVLKKGLYSFVKLPQRANGATTTLDHVSPSPDINAAREVLKEQLMSILEDHGITGTTGVNQSFNSALERMIANADLTKYIKSMQMKYKRVEQEIFDIISATEFAAQSHVFQDDSLTVIYQDEKPIHTEKEKLDNVKALLDLGLISKVNALMKLEPNMTLEQAEEQIEDANNEAKIQRDNQLEGSFVQGQTEKQS